MSVTAERLALGARPAPRVAARAGGRATLAVGLAFAALVVLVSVRALGRLDIVGHPDARHWVLSDFRDAIYYPVVAFLAGRNPYDAAAFLRDYPVGDRFPIYSPLTLLVHLPFGLLPYRVAEAAYYATTLGLMLLLAYLALRLCEVATTPVRLLAVTAAVLASRPGQWDLLLGQCAVQVTIGCYLALLYARERPLLAGAGLALASLKPTFGVPLAALMLCRGDVRAVLAGAAVAAVPTLAATAVLASSAGGIAGLLRTMAENYAGFAAGSDIDPASSHFRLDAIALVGRLLGHGPGTAGELAISAAVFLVAAWAIVRLAASPADGAARRWSACIACVAVLTCTYHMAYDAVLLAVPVTVLALGVPVPPGVRGPTRRVLLALIAVPAVNYLASGMGIDRVGVRGPAWLAVTSANGAALTLALLIGTLGLQRMRRET